MSSEGRTEAWPRFRALALVPVRWSGLALAVAFAACGMWTEFAVAMLVALAQVVAWRSALPREWECAVSAASLFAAVSSYLLLFERFPWWDIPTHFVLNGLVAVLVARVLRSGDPTPAVIVASGAAVAVVWELLEVAGAMWVDSSIHTAPADTVGDIIAGILGAVVAALLWRRGRGQEAEE